MLSRIFGKSQNSPTEKPDSEAPAKSWKAGLRATSQRLGLGLRQLLGRSATLESDTREELEDLLLGADVGIETTTYLLDELQSRLQNPQQDQPAEIINLFRQLLVEVMDQPVPEAGEIAKPQVLMVVGVNGVGKTTSIGKLAYHFKNQGQSVMLAAGDTFRAAATEQLQTWAERTDSPLVSQRQGADAASVIFDALNSAKARDIDLLIADTAGRLQNKAHLMEELGKVVRVMQKIQPDAPHEVWLVVDATTGQNALSQAREFAKIAPLTGLIITKMDGTAKGGVMLALAHQLKLPVRYLGLGEGIEDLRPFDATDVIDALLSAEDEN
jgi:fused signal recognition particle receptor